MLRDYEPFDNLQTSDLALRFGYLGAGVTVGAGGKVGQGLLLANNDTYAVWILDNRVTYVCSVWFKLDNLGSGNGNPFVTYMDGTTHQVLFFVNTSGKLTAMRGGSALLGTGSIGLSTGVWYHFQGLVTFDGSAGVVQGKINDALEINVSGVNTSQSGNAYANRVGVYRGAVTGNNTFDSLVVSDTQGSVNNGFLGAYTASSELPIADGADKDCTPSTGTDHYAVVDEAATNTTDYVSSSVAGNRDNFTFADSPSTAASIIGVKTAWYAEKDAVGARTITPYVKIGSTRYDAPSAQNLTTAWAFYQYIWETNPATTNAWQKSEVDAAEFGFLVG